MRGDERNWGLSEWVQEIRFTYLPLYMANRLDMARGLTPALLRDGAVPGRADPERCGDCPACGSPKRCCLGATPRISCCGTTAAERRAAITSAAIRARFPTGRFELYNPYVGFLFTAGLEVCHHYLLVLSLQRRRGVPAAGRLSRCSAACASSWPRCCVRKPTAAITSTRPTPWRPGGWSATRRTRWRGFKRSSRSSSGLSQDVRPGRGTAGPLRGDPRRRCRSRREGCGTRTARSIARSTCMRRPTARGPSHPRSNCENPALYRVFPFGLSGLGSPDYDLARRTFERRICVLAARLVDGRALGRATRAARRGVPPGGRACRTIPALSLRRLDEQRLAGLSRRAVGGPVPGCRRAECRRRAGDPAARPRRPDPRRAGRGGGLVRRRSSCAPRAASWWPPTSVAGQPRLVEIRSLGAGRAR